MKQVTLIVQFPYTQKQKGGSDCGVFAIAFAFHSNGRQYIRFAV